MDTMHCLVFFIWLFSPISGKSIHHDTPTYFHRQRPDGKAVDRANEREFQSGITCNQTVAIHVSLNSSLVAAPSVNIRNGQKILVAWEINSPVTDQDWIGLYCPQNAGASNALDYFYATVSTSWFDGRGSYSVHVFNLRSDCEFRYYTRVSAFDCALVAKSLVLQFEGGYAKPLQGHLAIGNAASEMRVMWTSGSALTPLVYYGSSPFVLSLKAYGTSSTYAAKDMCDSPATTTGFIDPGYLNDVLLTDLLPNALYFYQYGTTEGVSDIYNFTTPLPAGDPTPFSFLTFGDHGISLDSQSPGADDTSKNILIDYRSGNGSKAPRFIFHHGDISYALGYAYIWDQWHALVEPYTTLMPYMIGLGNHEQDHVRGGDKDPSVAPGEGFHPDWGNFGSDSGGECGVPVYFRFHMPDNGNAVWWYSFDYGLVHMIMMSTEHNYTRGSRQYLWLENDLKSVDRKKTPWVILGGHRPMYTTHNQPGDITVSYHMQDLFEDLLHEYAVDLALWSHVHSYQRTCKMYKQRCRQDGTVHIVVGSAGRSLDPDGFLDESWLVSKVIAFGYGRVAVANATHLYFEFVLNSDRSVYDSVWITK